jgi:DnaK suppressor protein
MKKELKKELKKKLLEEKENLESQLKGFADKDESIEGNWEANFPHYSDGGSSGDLDIATEEVEDYANRLSLEHVLEIRLLNVNKALEKIETEDYGKCEECNQDIPIERLKASPEAKYCIECKKKLNNEIIKKEN